MAETNSQYAHVMLFACPRCHRPLATACYNTKTSLEEADANWFTPHCHCGWTGDINGISAIKHWVEPWPYQLPVGEGAAGACEEHLVANPFPN